MKRHFPFFFGLTISFLLRVVVRWFVNKTGRANQLPWFRLKGGRGRPVVSNLFVLSLLILHIGLRAPVGHAQALPALLTAPMQGRLNIAAGSPAYAASPYTVKSNIPTASARSMPGLPAGVKPAADDVSDKVKQKANKSLGQRAGSASLRAEQGATQQPVCTFQSD